MTEKERKLLVAVAQKLAGLDDDVLFVTRADATELTSLIYDVETEERDAQQRFEDRMRAKGALPPKPEVTSNRGIDNVGQSDF